MIVQASTRVWVSVCTHTCVLKESWLGDQSRMWELSLGRLEDRSEEPQVPRSLDLTLRIVMLPGKAMC